MIQTVTQPTSLLPKEHGAYAMLLIPIATALLRSGPTMVGTCVAVAAVAGFLAHEPMLVARGHRGQRAQTGAPHAGQRFLLWLLLALVAGGAAFGFGNIHVRFSLGICFLFAVVNFGLSAAGYHRKTAVHLWGMLGLSLPCISILLAGGESVAQALSFWGVWIAGFMATMLGVRGMLANQKHQPRQLHMFAMAALTVLIGVGASLGCIWSLATLPMIGVNWYLLISPPHLKQLKRVGWVMVAGAVTTALLTIVQLN